MINKIRENNKTKLILTLGVWLLYIVWLLKFSSVKLDLANVLCYVGFLGLLLANSKILTPFLQWSLASFILYHCKLGCLLAIHTLI